MDWLDFRRRANFALLVLNREREGTESFFRILKAVVIFCFSNADFVDYFFLFSETDKSLFATSQACIFSKLDILNF